MFEHQTPDSLKGVADDRALCVELCSVPNMLPTTAAARSKMGTAGLDAIGARLDQAPNSSLEHLLPGSDVGELDAITGHAAVDEYDTTIG
jgi:hypothetical protein